MLSQAGCSPQEHIPPAPKAESKGLPQARQRGGVSWWEGLGRSWGRVTWEGGRSQGLQGLLAVGRVTALVLPALGSHSRCTQGKRQDQLYQLPARVR